MQGLLKNKFGANLKISSLKSSQFRWKFDAKSFIPIGSHSIMHLMVSVGLKFVFNRLPCPLYLHKGTNFSFTLSRGRLVFFWIANTKADIISIWLDAQKHLQIES